MNMIDSTDRYRTGTGWTARCIQCGRWFESKRDDAETCSSTCRTRRERAEAAKSLLRAKIQGDVRAFLDMTEKEPNEENVRVYLRLKSMIDHALI